MRTKSIRERAIKIRLEGKTYSDINRELRKKIPKSTLSVWFRNVKLSSHSQRKLRLSITNKLRKAQLKALTINKRRRQKYLDSLLKRNLHLVKEINIATQKLILCTLYLAEGGKYKSTPTLVLGSSNPKIIIFYLNLLRNCYFVSPQKFRVRIQCRADQNIKILEKFWQEITGIPSKQFYPTYIDKRTIGKPTTKPDYKGVCVLTYFSSEIQLELEMLAGSMVKSSSIGPVVQW